VQHLLASLTCQTSGEPYFRRLIIVPLDCEWIWHCHRLNLFGDKVRCFHETNRYKTDCEKLYGRVLGNHNIISSTQGTSMSKTKEIWNIMYPEEPYELEHNRKFPIVSQKSDQGAIFTNYDLVSAVGRQDSLYYQVMNTFEFNN
ncbi:Glycine-rich domain-containing protein 1, partial [Bienertia sinuspersici]